MKRRFLTSTTSAAATTATARCGAVDAPKASLLGLSKDEFAKVLSPHLAQAYRSKQLWKAIYERGVTDFDSLTELSKADRVTLNSKFTMSSGEVIKTTASSDGTTKTLIGFGNGANAECVVIPDPRSEDADNASATICVSSQVGCSLSCSFCHTGTQMLLRNLTPGEILAQIMHGMRSVQDFPLSPTKRRRLGNIVLMGQGEPLLNFRNVAQAVRMTTEALGLAPWRTTLSTSGVVPNMGRVAREIGCALAVSLHAVDDALRDVLVPINKQYPLNQLMVGVRDYLDAMPLTSRHRRVTFEYVMLKGVNDDPRMANRLARLIKRFPAHVNLIPFNPWPGSGYTASDPDAIISFKDEVLRNGVMCTIRKPRGDDVMAACGQLNSSSVRKRRFE